MFDIGWTEMLVVAVVALLVIGPKDLPRALRTVGHWVGKVKGIAREFQDSVDDMVRESELEEFRQGAKKLAEGDLDVCDESIDPTGGHEGPFAGPTGVEGRPRTAPPAREMLSSEEPATTADESDPVESDPVESDPVESEVAVESDPVESEVAGERPSADPESARTGT